MHQAKHSTVNPLILFIPRFEHLSNVTQCTEKHYVPQQNDKSECHKKLMAAKITGLLDKKWNGERNRYQILPDILGDGIWPTSTDVHCWWCCFPFTSVPVPIALSLDKRNVFKVLGNFCSFECATAFRRDKYAGVRDIECINKYLFHKMTKTPLLNQMNVKPAPPRQMLKIFGGPYSIDEFREAAGKHRVYEILPYQMMSINEHIEEMVNKTMDEVNVEVGIKPKSQKSNIDNDVISDLKFREQMAQAKVRMESVRGEKATKPKTEEKSHKVVKKKEADVNGMFGLRVVSRAKKV